MGGGVGRGMAAAGELMKLMAKNSAILEGWGEREGGNCCRSFSLLFLPTEGKAGWCAARKGSVSRGGGGHERERERASEREMELPSNHGWFQ